MAEPVAGLSVVIDHDDNSVRVNQATGTIERDQPDGGVIVQLDAKRAKKKDEEDGHYENLAERMDQSLLRKIGLELWDAINADDESRQNYLQIRARGMDYLGLELKEPRANEADTSAAVEGLSTVTNPLLLEACLKGWANAQGELLPADGPVKVENVGNDSQSLDDLAETLETDLNFWFTEVATEFYPDTSHMLLWGTYFGGSGFKKVYRCPLRRRPVSESVDAKDLIVSDTTKDLRSCERITHQISMRPSVMKRMKMMSSYRDIDVPQPYPESNAVDEKINAIQGTIASRERPEDQPYILWESQCELDLPEFAPGKFKDEGIPLPYLVTLDKESKEILSIRRNWEEDDEECERERMYVKYPYVLGPGFYGTGMLNILGGASATMTAAWRLGLDNAMFANFPSFLISKLGGRQNTSNIRVSPGTGVPIETNGQRVGDVAAPMPYRDITAGMFGMMDRVTQQAQGLGASAEVPGGEGIQNVPVGTMMAQIEQSTKIIAAAHKGMHRAMTEDIGLVVDLLRKTPEDFLRFMKGNGWDKDKFLKAIEQFSLVPASDPNIPSHIHRVAKALGLVQLVSMPIFMGRFDLKEAQMRILAAIKEDPNGLVIDPPPMPQGMPGQGGSDPLVGQARMLQAQVAQGKLQLDTQKSQADVALEQQRLASEREIESARLAQTMVVHRADAQREDRENQRAHALAVHKAGLEAQDQSQQQGLASGGHVLEVVKAHHDAQHETKEHEHQRQKDIAEHGLERERMDLEREQMSHEMTMAQTEHEQEMQRFAHEKEMAQKEHELAKKEAAKPQPKPTGKK